MGKKAEERRWNQRTRLSDENDMLRMANSQLTDAAAAKDAELAALRERVREMQYTLDISEFGGPLAKIGGRCSYCGQMRSQGHHSCCRVPKHLEGYDRALSPKGEA